MCIVYSLTSSSSLFSQVWAVNDHSSEKRFTKLERWYRFGGVALIGYDMFRNLAMGKRVRVKRKREAYKKFLLDPG